jgi:hypothetical protein
MLAVSDSYEVAPVVPPIPVPSLVSASELGPVDPPGPPVDVLDVDVLDDDVLDDEPPVEDVLDDELLDDEPLDDELLDDEPPVDELLEPVQLALAPNSGPVDSDSEPMRNSRDSSSSA